MAPRQGAGASPAESGPYPAGMDEARRLQLRRFAQMTPEERLRVGAGLSTIGLRWKREREARRAAAASTPYQADPAT